MAVGLDDGTAIVAEAVLITAGIGKFSPRPLPAGDGWVGRGMEFFVPSFAPYAGKDVVIVGGGDSAFDWALHLEPMAKSVTLVHRRDAFRAHQRTVDAVPTPASRSSPRRRSPRSAATASSRRSRSPSTARSRRPRPAQAVVAALGFIADLGAMQEWGLVTHKRHVVVDSAMRTNLPRVFAAGDITEYPGKVRLIAVGFGEAATAVNNAAVAIDPSAHVFPGHSSEAGVLHGPPHSRDAERVDEQSTRPALLTGACGCRRPAATRHGRAEPTASRVRIDRAPGVRPAHRRSRSQLGTTLTGEPPIAPRSRTAASVSCRGPGQCRRRSVLQDLGIRARSASR